MTNETAIYLDNATMDYWVKVNDEPWQLLGKIRPYKEYSSDKPGQLSLFPEFGVYQGLGEPDSKPSVSKSQKAGNVTKVYLEDMQYTNPSNIRIEPQWYNHDQFK